MTTKITETLTALSSALGDIEYALLFTIDGIEVGSTLDNEKLIDEVGAATAAMQTLSLRSCELLKRGELEQVQIHGKNGFIILTGITGDLVLAVMTKQQPNMGLVLHEIKRAKTALAEQV